MQTVFAKIFAVRRGTSKIQNGHRHLRVLPPGGADGERRRLAGRTAIGSDPEDRIGVRGQGTVRNPSNHERRDTRSNHECCDTARPCVKSGLAQCTGKSVFYGFLSLLSVRGQRVDLWPNVRIFRRRVAVS